MHRHHPHRRVIGWLGVLACVVGCGSADKSTAAGFEPPFRPWVEGGQTGALIPSCGLTAAAQAGHSSPGDGGIVVDVGQCVGLATADLALFDGQGTMVAFDLQPLPGGAVLLRPRAPLDAGTYVVRIAGKEMKSVVSSAPAMLPMTLGTISEVGMGCGANFTLHLDDAVLAYLPQLKLSVRVDGGDESTWFDYGALAVTDGDAKLSLAKCFPTCLADGSHSLEVTAELAGELGTLEPLELDFAIDCESAAQPIARNANEAQASAICSASAPLGAPGLDPPLLPAVCLAALAAVAALRTRRRKQPR